MSLSVLTVLELLHAPGLYRSVQTDKYAPQFFFKLRNRGSIANSKLTPVVFVFRPVFFISAVKFKPDTNWAELEV